MMKAIVGVKVNMAVSFRRLLDWPTRCQTVKDFCCSPMTMISKHGFLILNQGHERTYHAQLDGQITPEAIRTLELAHESQYSRKSFLTRGCRARLISPEWHRTPPFGHGRTFLHVDRNHIVRREKSSGRRMTCDRASNVATHPGFHGFSSILMGSNPGCWNELNLPGNEYEAAALGIVTLQDIPSSAPHFFVSLLE